MSAGHWTRLIGFFGLASMAIQGCGFLASIIWVRTLSVEEYAFYSLCLAAVSTGAVLGDLGVTSSLGYFWRRARQRDQDASPYMLAAFQIRVRFFILSAALVVTGLTGLLLYKSIPLPNVLLAGLLVVPLIGMSLNISFAASLLRLRSKIIETLLAEMLGAFVRLMGAFLAMIAIVNTALAGLLASLAGSLATLLLLRRWEKRPQYTAVSNEHERAEILSYLIPTLPSMLLFAFKDQILIWAAWISGGAEPVAATYALGRLAILFTLAGTFTTAIVMPRLAQVQDNRRFLLLTAIGTLSMASIGILMVLVATFQPQMILMLLGHNYIHLHSEMLLSLIAAGITMVALFLAQANRLRGWIRLEPIVAALYLVCIVAAVLLSELQTPMSVIVANLWLAIFGLATVMATTLLGVFGCSLVGDQTSNKNGYST